MEENNDKKRRFGHQMSSSQGQTEGVSFSQTVGKELLVSTECAAAAMNCGASLHRSLY